MSALFEKIKRLVREDKFLIGLHASERMLERNTIEWQVVAELEQGELLDDNLDALPNPLVEVKEMLPDGTEFKAVWSYLSHSDVAKLVTVHFFDR